MDSINFAEIWQSFLQTPAATYIALILLFVLVCVLIASVIRAILRSFMHTVKFFACFAVVVALLLFVSGKFAYKPLTKDPLTQQAQQAINMAIDQFGGVYSSKLPLVAWRFSQLQNEVSVEKSEDAELNPTVVRVQYLPFGEIQLRYNPENGEFTIEKGISEGSGSLMINTLFKSASKILPY